MIRKIVFSATVALAGCATISETPQTPALVTGTVTRPEFTGWYRNFCSALELVDFEPSTGDCWSHGGEIYKARLENPRVVGGRRLGRSIIIGYPAHALTPQYRSTTDMVLQPAPKAFRDRTGIFYLATDYGNYNKAEHCIVELAFAHTDFNLCPDKSFHETNLRKCVPVAEFLGHYTENP